MLYVDDGDCDVDVDGVRTTASFQDFVEHLLNSDEMWKLPAAFHPWSSLCGLKHAAFDSIIPFENLQVMFFLYSLLLSWCFLREVALDNTFHGIAGSWFFPKFVSFCSVLLCYALFCTCANEAHAHMVVSCRLSDVLENLLLENIGESLWTICMTARFM